MKVYLTFDDGIQAGTREVLEILKEAGVKATFFLIGMELRYAYRRNRTKFLKSLEDIYENHIIGNHSYSHANFYYSGYYSNNGVLIDDKGNRRSILDDFIKGKDQINEYLNMLDGVITRNSMFPLARHQSIPLARFPGRNTYNIAAIYPDGRGGFAERRLVHCEKDTQLSADQLFQAGYNIFGWNVEWEMSFDFYKDAIALKKSKEATCIINYELEEDVYPNLDMYALDNAGKDRPSEYWPTVLNKIMAGVNPGGGVILLMHDRAFRATHNGRSEVAGLKMLIDQLKALNVEFMGLDTYEI